MTRTSKKRSLWPASSSGTIEPKVLVEGLKVLFPDAACTLDFKTPFQCLVATLLSAQCTDAKVNKVTPFLFEKYPDAKRMAEASIEDIESIIKSLGLYHAKARNVLSLSRTLVEKFDGEVPFDFETLLKLPGVGKKTDGVVLAEVAARPAIPVDTHIKRVSARLGIVKEGTEPEKVEAVLESGIDKEEWIPFHHRFIAFGRNLCKAMKPECERCPFRDYCFYLRKASSKAAKKSKRGL